MKKIISILIMLAIATFTAKSQHITNTLGTGGVFKIHDGGSTYLSIMQSNGFIDVSRNIKLAYTTNSNVGVIMKEGGSFIHDFKGTGSLGGNTFMGYSSGNFTMTTASYNTGLGFGTLYSLTTGSRNTAIGNSSMIATTTGTDNSSLGTGSLFHNTTGSYNSAFGSSALYGNLNGSGNSSFGASSMLTNSSGSLNCAFGINSLSSNSTGSYNCAFGSNSLLTNSTGNLNSAFGNNTMENNSTGEQNTALGSSSLNNNSTGSYNNGIGVNSLTLNTTGSNNNAFGKSSLYFNTTGDGNVAMGTFSLFNNITADNNTAIGIVSLYSNSTGYSNTGIGSNSLQGNTTGAGNTSIGSFSMTGNTTGQLNTVIGYQAGTNIINGSNVILLGYNTEPTTSSVSNQITLGNNSITSLRCNVTTITSLSDARDKKNINDLPLGLSFISKLKPRLYNWDKREWYDGSVSDGSKMQEAPTAGFIAQELDEVQTSENAEWLNLVLKDNPEKWEATPGNLLPVMVKAIQELKEENDKLKVTDSEMSGKYNELKQENSNLLERLRHVEKLLNIYDSPVTETVNNSNPSGK